MLRRWKECFEKLINKENKRERRVMGVETVQQEVGKINKDEVSKALKMVKNGKAVDLDDMPLEL